MQYLGLKRSYKELRETIADAEKKLNALAGAPAEPMRLLDQAALPGRIVWPNHRLFLLAALALGLAAGACFTVMVESRRFKFLKDASDVERYARVPLLVTIPRTLTAGERKLAARKAKIRLAICTAFAAAGTVVLSEIFVITDIFALLSEK
jgi:hypothetical protein